MKRLGAFLISFWLSLVAVEAAVQVNWLFRADTETDTARADLRLCVLNTDDWELCGYDPLMITYLALETAPLSVEDGFLDAEGAFEYEGDGVLNLSFVLLGVTDPHGVRYYVAGEERCEIRKTFGGVYLECDAGWVPSVGMWPEFSVAAAEGDFLYEWGGGGYWISARDGQSLSGDLVIPETYEGCEVVGIGEYGFAWCENLTSVQIPATVRMIGGYAFCDCTALTNVTWLGDCPFASYEESVYESSNENLLNWVQSGADGWSDLFGERIVAVTGTAPRHRVRFDLAGHGWRKGGGEILQAVADGVAATAPSVDSESGYAFAGWDCDFSQVVSNLTVTARYDLVDYQIVYENTRDCDNSANPTVYTVESEIVFSPLTDIEGWRFVGWSPERISRRNTGDKTIVAQWERVWPVDDMTISDVSATWRSPYDGTVDVVFTIDGIASDNAYAVGLVVMDAEGNELVQPTVVGGTVSVTVANGTHTLRWNADADFSGQRLTGMRVKVFVRSVEIEPERIYWSEAAALTGVQNVWTVTFDLGERGTRTGGGALEQEIVEGYGAVAPVVSAVNGYAFGGWNAGFSSVSNNLTVCAVYSPVVYTITYTNTKNSYNPNPTRYTIESDAITFVPLSDFGRQKFVGWSVSGIAAGSTGNVVVTASWEEIEIEETSQGVPYEWIDRYGLAPDGDYEAAAERTSANGYTVWQSYVAGLDPTNPGSRFGVDVREIRNDKVLVELPPIIGGRNYEVQASQVLDREWEVVYVFSAVGSGPSVSLWLSSYNGPYYRVRVIDPVTGHSVVSDVVRASLSSLFSEAVDIDNLDITWTTDGDNSWFVDSTDCCEGGASLRSGAVYDGGESRLTASLSGSGILTFKWKVVYEDSWGYLAFRVDGELIDCLAYDSPEWASVSVKLPAGDHTLEWVYHDEDACSYGYDFGRVDSLSWTPQATYTVTFDLGAHGTRTGGGELTQIVEQGEAAVAPEVTPKAGYEFVGWDCDFSSIMSRRAVTAQYQPIAYTITYADTKGADNSANPTTYTVENRVVFRPLANVAGWRFVGWSPSGIATGSTGDQTVTAQWEAREAVSVIFDLGEHGTRTGGGELTQTVETWSPVVAPEVTPDPGYVFTGWDCDFSAVKEAMTVTAQYEPIAYAITYSDTKGAANPNSKTYTVEDAMTFAAPANVAGWRFTGWSPSGIEKGMTGDLSVTAQWETITYAITYSNTKGVDNSANPTTYTIESDTITFAPLADVEGWRFGGWSVSGIASGSTGAVSVRADWIEVEGERGLWFVNAATGSDTNSGLRYAEAFQSIQKAIDVAAAGDEILVYDGEYAPIRTDGKAICIRSVNGSNATTINAELDGRYGTQDMEVRCATMCPVGEPFDSVTRTNTVLKGFTLVNGRAEVGGGVFGGLLEQCTLRCNRTYSEGLGTLDLEHGGTAYNADLRLCGLTDGGEICRCRLDECVADSLIVENCFVRNSTLTGCQVRNATVILDDSSGMFPSTRFENSILWSSLNQTAWRSVLNSAASVASSCLSSLPNRVTKVELLEGNIVGEPRFADAANGDYRLAADSPCIDAGYEVDHIGRLDLAGNPRVCGGRIDMGAFEFQDGTGVMTYVVRFDAGAHGTCTGGAALTQVVARDAAAVAPEVTADDGYEFAGWDRDFSSVTGNMTVTARYLPHEWIEKSGLLEEGRTDYESAASAVGKNGLPVWESFVAGLNPTNETSQFTASVKMVDGKPVVTWEPDLNMNKADASRTPGLNRIYIIKAKQRLEDKTWTDFAEDAVIPPDYHFYKIEVCLP